MWTCVNGHDVRDGMFVCPRCGTDQVADPDRPAAPAPVPDRDEVRVAARSEIANRATAGVALVLVGVVGHGVRLGIDAAGSPRSDGGAGQA